MARLALRKGLNNSHALICGATGAGKSKLMELMFFDMQRKSQNKKQFALMAIDPHSDFARRLLYFAHNSDKERLVYISSSINREANTNETYTCIVNPFETEDKSEEMKNILTAELTESIAELLADTTHNLTVQMTALLRPCIHTVLGSKDPSMETLARFFLDKDSQNEDLIHLGRQSVIPQYRVFFTHDWFSAEYTLTKRSIRTKLFYFLADPVLSNMLCGRSTISIEKSLNEGKVIIVSLPKGSGKFTSSVFSRLLIAYVHSIMLRRDTTDSKLRKHCYMFLDEFQTMITGSLASSMSELRKFGLSMVLATQSLKQIDSTTLKKTIMVNTGIKMISLTDHDDKVTFAKEFGVPTETLNKLQSLQFIVKKNDGRHKAFTFRVPILAKRYFLSKAERKKLLEYIVYESGMYIKVTPPAPPPNPLPKQPITKKYTKTKKTKDNPFDENLDPAF